MPISDPPEGRWGWAPDGVDAATSHVPTLRLCCHPMPKQGVGCGWLVCSSRHQHAMMQGRAPASPWLHACATAWDRGLHIGSTYGRNMHQQPQAAAGQCMLQLERPTVCTRMLHPGQQHRGSPPSSTQHNRPSWRTPAPSIQASISLLSCHANRRRQPESHCSSCSCALASCRLPPGGRAAAGILPEPCCPATSLAARCAGG
jgi:hypothetical protein